MIRPSEDRLNFNPLYNEAHTEKEKLALLRGIFLETNQISTRYPEPLLERHHRGFKHFWDRLKTHFESLGIESLEQDTALLPLKIANIVLLDEIRTNYVKPDIQLIQYFNEQRDRIHAASSIDQLTQLQKALAAHRNPSQKGAELLPNGQIDPKKASRTYQTFSANFFAEGPFEDDVDDSDDEFSHGL